MNDMNKTYDRRTPNKSDLKEMALMLLDHAEDIEAIFPYQANSLRNMAKVISPEDVISV